MKNIIALIIIALIIGLALKYIIKSKKSGAKCIGCPSGSNCSAKQKSECNCSNTEK